MIRRSLRVLALFLPLAIADDSTGWATTFIPRLTNCPVCGKAFVIMTIGSYNTFGEQARDLSTSPFVRFAKVRTCPYCLYSALDSDFDHIATAEKDAVRKLLADDFRVKPCPEELKALTAAGEDSRLRDQDYLGFLVARECNALRKPDARREFRLSLLLFYQSKYVACEELCEFYRKRAIEALQGELGSGRFSKHEQATFTYLLGELLRQDGQNDAAIHEFTRAAAMAKPLLESKAKDTEESCQWIIDWSREQSCRARFATESAEKLRPLLAEPKNNGDVQAQLQREIALETLAARTDRDSWRVLADFAEADTKNLDYLVEKTSPSERQLQIEPRLWELVQRQYAAAVEKLDQEKGDRDLEEWRRFAFGQVLAGSEYKFSGNQENAAVLQNTLPALNRGVFVEVRGHPTETVKDVADRLAASDPWASEPERLIELNPRFKTPSDKIDAQPLRVIRTPPVWTETRLIANLHRVIRSGDRQAIEYFFRWCRTVGPVGLDRFKYYLADCFDALAADTTLWSVPPDLQASNVAEQRFLACCLRYLHGDGKEAQELLAYLEGKAESEASLAADCFFSRRDLAVKEPILKHWEEGKRYEWFVNYKVREYLSRVLTPEDLPRIEAITAHKNVDRHDIEEDILMTVRFREFLRWSLKTKATAGSQ